MVDHSDVVKASPLAAMDWAKTTARRDENRLSFGNWCALYYFSVCNLPYPDVVCSVWRADFTGEIPYLLEYISLICSSLRSLSKRLQYNIFSINEWVSRLTKILVVKKLPYPRYQGAVSIRKTVLPGMAIPMLKIRRPNGRLIFNMEIAIRR